MGLLGQLTAVGWLAIAFCVMTGFGLIVLVKLVVDTIRLKRHGVMVTGTVIRQQLSGEDDDMYAPVFRYELTNDEIREYESNFYRKKPRYQVGEHCDLIYDANCPENITIHSFWGMYGNVLIVGAVMTMLLFGCAAFFISGDVLMNPR